MVQSQNVNMNQMNQMNSMGNMANMGNMGNQQVNMQGMMNQGQPMQQTISNQGNPMAAQFNPQLARPMQVSQLPNNGQMQQGMQNGGMNNQGQNQNQNQAALNAQQQNNQALTMTADQKIQALAMKMHGQATPDQKTLIMNKFLSLPQENQLLLRQRHGDPILAHYRSIAQNIWMKQMGGLRQNQGAQNGMQTTAAGPSTPTLQRGQPQQPQTGQQDAQLDLSQFMMQQQDAIRSADSGQLVVPASNNAAMNGNVNGMPLGLAPNQMGNGMNNNTAMQAMMQQRQGGMTPQQQAALRLQQAQMRGQGANGQGNQQGQMAPQPKPNSSPMAPMAQPNMQQVQRPPTATPQQRPNATPTPQMPQQQSTPLNPQLLHAITQAAKAQQHGQPQPIRRPLPPDLPPNTQHNLLQFLQTCSDEHYNVAIEHIRKTQIGATAQMQNGMNNMMQNNAAQNAMMQNSQQNPQLLMQQQRMVAQRAAVAQNQARAAQQGMPLGMHIPPEILQQMDQQPFPRTILEANGVTMAPQHVTNFLQLKEWVVNNPQLAGNLSSPSLMKFQMELWRRRQQQAQQSNLMNQQRAQMANGQPGASGPAPTAPMVPPGGMNNMGQQPAQQQQLMMTPNIAQHLHSVQVTPQEIAMARQQNVETFPPSVSDDEIRGKILNIKRQQIMQRLQQQHRAQVMAQGNQVAQNNGGNPVQNQRMQNQVPPQNQRPNMPGQQTPQMTVATPTQQTKQPAQRPNQQQAANKQTPQQATKNLKRPAPDEVIEIRDNSVPAQQAPSMQAQKSQQGRQNAANTQQGPAPDAQQQAVVNRFTAILSEVKAQHKARVATPLNDQERQQLTAKVNELKPIITRTEWAIRLFFQGTKDETKTKGFLMRYWHMADNVNPKEGVVLGQATIRAHEFEQLIQPVRQLVVGMMQSSKNQSAIEASKTQNGQNGQQQAPVAPAAPITPGSQLNAANLEAHNTSLRAAQGGHRRSNSKAQVPQAPTAGPGQNPFNFNTASPQGVPKYGEGAGNLTSDKLTMPGRKKARKDGQPPSGQSTPAHTGMSPPAGKTASPQMKKQPAPEQKPTPQNLCQDPSCEFSRKGFKSQEELANHMRQMHAPPADPLKFAMETLATSMGLNADGTVKVEVDAKPPQKSAVGVKMGGTPPAGVKAPMKGSPALDRLKVPQHANKIPAPTSAAGPSGDISIRTDEVVKDENLDFDPWKNSALAQNDLLEWLKPYDTVTGDWGNDRALRSPQLTPATTPDTNVTDKTASSDVLEVDGLSMNLNLGMDDGIGDFMSWDPSVFDEGLLGGFEEGLVLGPSDSNNENEKSGGGGEINDWEAMFGDENGNAVGGGAVPGWEGLSSEMVF